MFIINVSLRLIKKKCRNALCHMCRDGAKLPQDDVLDNNGADDAPVAAGSEHCPYAVKLPCISSNRSASSENCNQMREANVFQSVSADCFIRTDTSLRQCLCTVTRCTEKLRASI